MARAKKSVELPKGFKPISGGNYAPTWDYRANPTLQGKIVKFSSVPSRFKRGTMQKNCTVALTGGGEVTVWESAGTAPVFSGDVEVGAKIFIRYNGEKKIPGRKSPMHDFTVATA